jgi:neurotransmitter:Na+ symporter, NSS family
MAYVFKAFTGSFSGASPAEVKAIFESFVASPMQLIFWHSVFMVVTMLIVGRGIEKGFEQSVRWLMPSLFALMILLVGYAMTTDGYFQGRDFLFKPDFSKLTANSVLVAMGQAFFSLSLGMGAIMVYGAYLPKGVSIAKASMIIAGADTVVALLAGIAIFPIVFSNGLPLNAGPGLVFETLPIAFGNMFGGWLFGVMFFVALVFAALTSSISLVEPAVAWLIENQKFSREKASLCAGLLAWTLGLGTVFSFNAWKNIKLFDRTFFELTDYLTANLMLPIGGFCIAVFAGWIMQKEHSKAELDLPGEHLSYQVWKFLVCYVAPAAVFLVFLNVVGVL